MIRNIKKIPNVWQYCIWENVIVRIDSTSKQLVIHKADFSEDYRLEGEHNGFVLKGNLLLDSRLLTWDLKRKIKVRTIEDQHYVFHNEKYLVTKVVRYEIRQVDYFLIDTFNFGIQKKIKLPGSPIAISNGIIICRKYGVYGFDISNELIRWQLDLSGLCSYDVGNGLEKAELSNIYSDDEFVYLLAGLSVVKVSIQSGEIIWHANLATAQSRGLVYGGYLYTTSNAYINKIDCQTGEILYQVGFDYFSIGNKKELGPIKELVWYQDSIWTVMDSNPSALIEINPCDGSYISVIPLKELGITRDCHMPRFHKNRMYLLDSDNTLHIFEMGKEF